MRKNSKRQVAINRHVRYELNKELGKNIYEMKDRLELINMEEKACNAEKLLLKRLKRII